MRRSFRPRCSPGPGARPRRLPNLLPTRGAAKRRALEGLGFTQVPEGWGLNLSGRVLFAPDDATLSSDGEQTIAQVARTLLGVGIDHVTVEGHTDNVGAGDHNLRLSQRRAESVARQLVERGFSDANIVKRGYGSSRPIAENTNEAGRAQEPSGDIDRCVALKRSVLLGPDRCSD